MTFSCASTGKLSLAGFDADHRVPGAVQQPVEHTGGDAFQVVGGMVGLQAYAEVAGQADGVAKARHHLAFAGGKDQILIAHQLTDRRRHLRGDARATRCSVAVSVASSSSQSRKSPTVR